MTKVKSRWITTSEAAKLHGLTPRAIRKAAHKERFKFRKDNTSGGRGKMLIEISGDELKKFNELQLASTSNKLIQVPNKVIEINDFNKEIPVEYIKTGQKKAQLCNKILEMIDEGSNSKEDIYIIMSNEYKFSYQYSELRTLTVRNTYSTRSLERMVSEYTKSGRDFMALVPKYINTNDFKRDITMDELYWLTKQLFNPSKVKIGSAIKYIKYLASKGEIISSSSESTLRRAAEELIKKNSNEFYLAQNGEGAFINNRVKSILRDWNELKVGDMFIADGHRLNFNIIDPLIGKPKRMLLVVFMDARSRYVCGASIASNEDTKNISSALRMAVNNLGRAPKVVYLDNGKAFGGKYFTNKNLKNELGGLYDRLGCKVIFAEPYNAKAKPIERLFRTFDDDFERKMDSYVGSSLQDRPAYYKRNEKWMQEKFEKIPLTLEKAYKMINLFFTDFYANQPHRGLNERTPAEVFLEQKPKSSIKIKQLDYLMLSVENRVVGRQGIQLFKELYWNIKLMNHFEKKITIRYDFNDLSYIKIYINNLLICKALKREDHPPILDTELEKKKLNKERAENAGIVEEAKTSLANLLDGANDNLVNTKPIPLQQAPSIFDMDNSIIKKPWDKQGIAYKRRFGLFIKDFGRPFTMKEAATSLQIKYGTIKKLVQEFDNKIIKRNGMRDGSVLFEKIDNPIVDVTKNQIKFDFEYPPEVL